MYDRIMVAIDESATSKLVLKEAITFVKMNPTSILSVIYIADENVVYLDTQPIMAPIELQKIIKENGLNLLKEAEEQLKAANLKNFQTKMIETSSLETRVEELIVEEAQRWKADLIMIGTHGRKGFHRLFLGSVAEGVIRIAPVPVLLLRSSSA